MGSLSSSSGVLTLTDSEQTLTSSDTTLGGEEMLHGDGVWAARRLAVSLLGGATALDRELYPGGRYLADTTDLDALTWWTL